MVGSCQLTVLNNKVFTHLGGRSLRLETETLKLETHGEAKAHHPNLWAFDWPNGIRRHNEAILCQTAQQSSDRPARRERSAGTYNPEAIH